MGEVSQFGERCSFAENQALFCAGDYPFNSHVILSGTVRVVDVSTGKRSYSCATVPAISPGISICLRAAPEGSRAKLKQLWKRFDSCRLSFGIYSLGNLN